MMSGISSEKPAEVFVRWIERIWSAYDVIGERIRLEKQGGKKFLFFCRLLASQLPIRSFIHSFSFIVQPSIASFFPFRS